MSHLMARSASEEDHMTERIQHVIERLVDRFSSQARDFEALMRRARQRKARQRLAVGIVVVPILALSWVLVARAFLPSIANDRQPVGLAAGAGKETTMTTQPTPPTTEPTLPPVISLPVALSPPASPPACPGVGPGGFTPDFSSVSGPSGSTVTVSAPVAMFGPGGDFRPSPWGLMQVWWNVAPNQADYLNSKYAPRPTVLGQLGPWTIQPPQADNGWPDVAPGPGGIGLMGEWPDLPVTCQWSITFDVPNVPLGTYPVAVVSVDVNPAGGSATTWGWAGFQVTP